MPDRAVVDELVDKYGEPMGLHFALAEALPALKQQAIEEYKASQSRAIVAISPDRQWLAVLFPNVHKWRDMWAIIRCTYHGDYLLQEHVPDTGQSADEVLADFLSARTP